MAKLAFSEDDLRVLPVERYSHSDERMQQRLEVRRLKYIAGLRDMDVGGSLFAQSHVWQDVSEEVEHCGGDCFVFEYAKGLGNGLKRGHAVGVGVATQASEAEAGAIEADRLGAGEHWQAAHHIFRLHPVAIRNEQRQRARQRGEKRGGQRYRPTARVERERGA